jgi:hypothetical protein
VGGKSPSVTKKQKRYLLIIVSVLAAVGLVLSAAILTGVELFTYRESIFAGQLAVHGSQWNALTFNDSSGKDTIFRFYFVPREETANGTELSLGLGVMLWHAHGTAVRALTIDMQPPLPSCDCNISLVGGMGYPTYGYQPFQVFLTNESKNVVLRIDNLGPFGMIQNFSFGTGVRFTGNPTLPLTILLSISVVLYRLSTVSLGSLVVYNGTAPVIGTNYYGNASLTVSA